MNYARVREIAKKKLAEKKPQISAMSGEDRTKMEESILKDAEKEASQEQDKKELASEPEAPKQRGRPKAS